MKSSIKIQQVATLKSIAKIWNKYPDYRLGQLVGNVFPIGGGIDPYHLGDAEFIRRMEAFYNPKQNPIK